MMRLDPIDEGTFSSQDLQEAAARPETECCCSTKRNRVRTSGMGLSVLGVLGWLALPKCPLCLTAYLAVISGISISAAYGRLLYVALVVATAACFLWGAWRVMRHNLRVDAQKATEEGA